LRGRNSHPIRSTALHVLFVCTGNICRSPTAERLAAAYFARVQEPHIQVSSAGTRAVVSHAIHPEAARVLVQYGADPSNFAARQLTSRIAAQADLILTMTREHRDAVLTLAPRQLRSTFTVAEASRMVTEFRPEGVSELASLRPRLSTGSDLDIRDPIGHSAEVFEEVGSTIANHLKPILELCRRSV